MIVPCQAKNCSNFDISKTFISIPASFQTTTMNSFSWIYMQNTKIYIIDIWLCKVNFEPLTRKQPHATDVNHSIVSSLTPRSPGALCSQQIFCYAWCTIYFDPELSSSVVMAADKHNFITLGTFGHFLFSSPPILLGKNVFQNQKKNL